MTVSNFVFINILSFVHVCNPAVNYGVQDCAFKFLCFHDIVVFSFLQNYFALLIPSVQSFYNSFYFAWSSCTFHSILINSRSKYFTSNCITNLVFKNLKYLLSISYKCFLKNQLSIYWKLSYTVLQMFSSCVFNSLRSQLSVMIINPN